LSVGDWGFEGPQRVEEFQKARFQVTMASEDGMIRVRADSQALRSCRESLSDDRIGLSPCRANLRHRHPSQRQRGTILIDDRLPLSCDRDPQQPGKTGKTIRHGAK
jgi:hypothetical protein